MDGKRRKKSLGDELDEVQRERERGGTPYWMGVYYSLVNGDNRKPHQREAHKTIETEAAKPLKIRSLGGWWQSSSELGWKVPQRQDHKISLSSLSQRVILIFMASRVFTLWTPGYKAFKSVRSVGSKLRNASNPSMKNSFFFGENNAYW